MLESELAKLWTQGVQDGVVVGIILAMLAVIGVWLRKALVAVCRRIWAFCGQDVVVPRWALIVLIMFSVGIAHMASYGALQRWGMAFLAVAACCCLIFWGTVLTPQALKAGITEEALPSSVRLTDEDEEILKLFIRQKTASFRMPAEDIAAELKLSVHFAQHRIDVLLQEGLLRDSLASTLVPRMFYLSEQGRATALGLAG